MKELLINLNKHFENRIRLGIMSVLMVNDWVDFNTMKETLNVTDGNLASHMKALEAEKYVEVKNNSSIRSPIPPIGQLLRVEKLLRSILLPWKS
jgi:transcriptional regulator